MWPKGEESLYFEKYEIFIQFRRIFKQVQVLKILFGSLRFLMYTTWQRCFNVIITTINNHAITP